mmetsp:Transcript_17703/g.62016  ORF Transcript_17703/g.62016 Transcript_17703/m.62016 type:complete len:247 (-) Transcript_17703:1158-1898(-)
MASAARTLSSIALSCMPWRRRSDFSCCLRPSASSASSTAACSWTLRRRSDLSCVLKPSTSPALASSRRRRCSDASSIASTLRRSTSNCCLRLATSAPTSLSTGRRSSSWNEADEADIAVRDRAAVTLALPTAASRSMVSMCAEVSAFRARAAASSARPRAASRSRVTWWIRSQRSPSSTCRASNALFSCATSSLASAEVAAVEACHCSCARAGAVVPGRSSNCCTRRAHSKPSSTATCKALRAASG